MRITKIRRGLFLLTFISIFIYIYRKSDERGFVRWICSLRTAIIITAAVTSLISIPAEESKTIGKPNSIQIEKIINSKKIKNSTKLAQALDLKYLNHDKRRGYSRQALVLSQKIEFQNSNLYSGTLVSKTLQIRGGVDHWKFGPGSKARGAAAQNAGRGGGLFVEGFTTYNPYRHQHRYPVRIRAKDGPNPFQHGNGGNCCGGNPSNDINYPDRSGEPETENERLFRECSINPQTGEQDTKSVLETRAALQLKREGNIISSFSRPDNPDVDLDFKFIGVGEYEHITDGDIKTPDSFEALRAQGIKPSGPKTYSKVGASMGRKLIKQKSRFCGLEGGPKGPENVLHVIDLRRIPDYEDKSTIVTHLLDAAERAGNTTDNIIFLNFD